MKHKIDKRRKFQIGDKAKLGPKAKVIGSHKKGMVVKIVDYNGEGLYDVKSYTGTVWYYYTDGLIKY